MMTEICQYLKNWFDRGFPKLFGTFTIQEGTISQDGEELAILDGQYYRIMGSALNDGVWQKPQGENDSISLRDETFEGSVWLMGVPPAVVAISEEIDEWEKTYGGVSGNSPYTSESFSGYSYSKAQGGTLANGALVTGWEALYGARLARWKKL